MSETTCRCSHNPQSAPDSVRLSWKGLHTLASHLHLISGMNSRPSRIFRSMSVGRCCLANEARNNTHQAVLGKGSLLLEPAPSIRSLIRTAAHWPCLVFFSHPTIESIWYAEDPSNPVYTQWVHESMTQSLGSTVMQLRQPPLQSSHSHSVISFSPLRKSARRGEKTAAEEQARVRHCGQRVHVGCKRARFYCGGFLALAFSALPCWPWQGIG